MSGISRGWTSMAVNVSAHSLLDPSFARQVSDIAAAAGVPLTKLELELTESSVMVDPRGRWRR